MSYETNYEKTSQRGRRLVSVKRVKRGVSPSKSYHNTSRPQAVGRA